MDQITHRSLHRKASGFSLIEVMIAVVVLATGLLALTALQGTLARSSADAKARGAIMSALSSRISQLRQTPPADGQQTFTCAGGATWICSVQQQANTTGLSISQQVGTLLWKGGTFQVPVAGDDLSGPAFKRFTLTATWTDAANTSRSLALRSDASGLMYGLGYPDPDPNSSALARPILRQKDPGLEAGVIPIAYGSGSGAQSTAASNPKPVLIGQSTVVGTQFDVLTYVPQGSEAIIRRRIDTNVIKCRCSTGLADRDRYSVAGVAQWPTVWTGNAYETYKPSSNALPPGEALKAGEDAAYAGRNRKQSELCTECCRDHHDEASMAVRFNPEGGTERFDLSNGGVLSVSASGKFVAACRVIKDDGIYKTASDMYLRQFALLETSADPATSTDPLNFARSGVPKPTATMGYGDFVKQYLGGYITSVSTSGTAPTSTAAAQQAFDDFGKDTSNPAGALNHPANVQIAAPVPSDERFLHARGLYVDYLTPEARQKIKNALDTCSYTDKIECLLPNLAFTTINMTELAKWSAGDAALEVTEAGTLLGTSVNEPMGGRTYGLKKSPSSYTNVSSSLSNSTLAFRADIPFVNTSEADPNNWLKDRQQFSVGGSDSGGGNLPFVEVVPKGLLSDSSLTRVAVTLTGASGAGSCTPGSTSYICRTADKGLPANVGLQISNYNVSETANVPTVPVTCGNKTFDQPRPFKINYSAISVSDSDGGAPLGSVSYNPAASRADLQTASWAALSRDTGDKLYVTFSGGEKSCPTSATCGTGNKFGSWGTTYTAAACDIPSYNP